MAVSDRRVRDSASMTSGFAKQSQSFTKDWLCEAKKFRQLDLLCEAKPIHHQKRLWQSQSITMERLLCFAKQTYHKGKQSQPITMDWFCETKPIQHNRSALRISKANPAQLKRFAKGRQSINLMNGLCEAKPIKLQNINIQKLCKATTF